MDGTHPHKDSQPLTREQRLAARRDAALVGDGDNKRHAIAFRAEQLEAGDEGKVTLYLAEWDKINSHNEICLRGCFAKSIAERFDKIVPNMHHDWKQPLASKFDVLREDERGLYAEFTIVGFDDPKLNETPWLQVKNGLITGGSIEFNWAKSSWRELSDDEIQSLRASGQEISEHWWEQPIAFDRIYLLGAGLVLHPSADGARIEEVRSADPARPEAPHAEPVPTPEQHKPTPLVQGLRGLVADCKTARHAIQAKRNQEVMMTLLKELKG